MGGYEARSPDRVEPTVKYHSFSVCYLTAEQAAGPRLVGSLTGAVASQRVTEAPKGSLRLVGNQPLSAMAEGSFTARPTSQADAKAGHSDPAIACGSVVAQRIKGTPGITG